MAARASAAGRQAAASLGYDWAVTFGGLWLLAGLQLDSWAHHRIALESFFTPWHAVLYSGYFALAAVLASRFALNVSRGYGWRQALPRGYNLSLLGAGIFLVGGVGDMTWHIVFGIEKGIEALLSPTHLLLALGGGLMVTGPLRAAWQRAGEWPGRWAEWLPALLSLTMLLVLLTFFTVYSNPIGDAKSAAGLYPSSAGHLSEENGIASILLQTGLLMGVTLLALRRWRPPFGSLALIFGVQTLFTASPHGEWVLVPFAVIAGLAADLLASSLHPGPQRPSAYRFFAFLVPVIYFVLYFATLELWHGVWWRIHMWGGAIVMAGIAGWLISYAFLPPPLPARGAAGDDAS